MIALDTPLDRAIIDVQQGDGVLAHFGRVRITDRFVYLHEDEPDPRCCDSGEVLVLPVGRVEMVTVFPSDEAYREAVEGLQLINSKTPRAGIEVR